MSIFENISEIGSGGFGQVWVCRNQIDGDFYAKKVLQDSIDEDGVKRFLREVRIVSSLDHPNIVKVVSKQLDTEPYYYVMPMYKSSLANELANVVGQEDRIKEILSHILDAMEYAHAQGVIHRDLKPENVLMNDDRDLVVSDFGLGRIINSQTTRQTMSGFAMGTILYMAPEQMMDAKRADARSDIYSLGRIMYELYNGSLTSFAQDLSELPSGVSAIISKCTQQNPERRFQNISELKLAWKGIFDAKVYETEFDELIQLKQKLSADDDLFENFEVKDVERFIVLLSKKQDKHDFLHEVFMSIRASAIVKMCDIDLIFTQELINRFVKFTSESSWGFDYTDRIADQCRKVYRVVNDIDLRASLIRCVIQVGAAHNRFYVMGVAASMLEDDKQSGEVIRLRDVLIEISESARQMLSGYVNRIKLHPAIRSLIPEEA